MRAGGGGGGGEELLGRGSKLGGMKYIAVHVNKLIM